MVIVCFTNDIVYKNSVHDDSIMSYLIALYIFYHGNNLIVFGIHKGAKVEDLDNSGLKRPEEIDPTLVDPKLIAAAKRQEELEKQPTWEELMRKAMLESQKHTYKLQQSGEIQNSIFEHTPDAVMDEIEENQGGIDLDFFNTLNNF